MEFMLSPVMFVRLYPRDAGVVDKFFIYYSLNAINTVNKGTNAIA